MGEALSNAGRPSGAGSGRRREEPPKGPPQENKEQQRAAKTAQAGRRKKEARKGGGEKGTEVGKKKAVSRGRQKGKLAVAGEQASREDEGVRA